MFMKVRVRISGTHSIKWLIQIGFVIRGLYVPLFVTSNAEFTNKHSHFYSKFSILNYTQILCMSKSEFAGKKNGEFVTCTRKSLLDKLKLFNLLQYDIKRALKHIIKVKQIHFDG
jgi:hypothetical protein